jgi:hypothetical protein
MPSLFYFAAWDDSDSLVGCDHHHETIVSAVACCAAAGAYVIAVEEGCLRELNANEETQFQQAMYGNDGPTGRFFAIYFAILAFLSRFAGYHC